MTAGVAFFDEYPGPVLGHHPDLILGLARAAARSMPGAVVQVFCPPAYLTDGRPPGGVEVRPIVGRRLPVDVELARRNLEHACREARAGGISAVVNLFFDETHAGVPLGECGLRFLHVIHRAGELPGTPEVLRRLAALAERDAFVVHTERGRELLERLVPEASIYCIPWPAATLKEVKARFAVPAVLRRDPHVLMVGGARRDKGIATLLDAVEGGPPLRIVGELTASDARDLKARATSADMTWDRRWVDRRVIEEAIHTAAVVVFPYLPEFGEHAGASGAVAHVQTFAKPLIVSDVLAGELVTDAACIQVAAGDTAALRQAIEVALKDNDRLHEAARSSYEAVSRAHTYEGHLARLLEAAADSDLDRPGSG